MSGLALVLCGADLITKQRIFAWLGPPHDPVIPVWWVWEGYFGFQTSLNQGALFGMGQGFVLGFAAFSVVALVGIGYWFFFHGAAYDLGLTVTLGLISGGILGNLYDRLGLWHHPRLRQPTYAVRDWILCQYGPYVWPNFNLADCFLVSGAVLIAIHSCRSNENASPEKTPARHGDQRS